MNHNKKNNDADDERSFGHEERLEYIACSAEKRNPRLSHQ